MSVLIADEKLQRMFVWNTVQTWKEQMQVNDLKRFTFLINKKCLKKQFDVCEIDMNTQTFSFKKQILTICQNFMKKMKSDLNEINEIKTEVKFLARFSMQSDVLQI